MEKVTEDARAVDAWSGVCTREEKPRVVVDERTKEDEGGRDKRTAVTLVIFHPIFNKGSLN